MPSTLEDLREHLFETLKALRSKEMDVDRARAISEIAGKVIDSAKVEVDYVRATGRDDLALPVIEPKVLEGPGLPGVKVHKIR